MLVKKVKLLLSDIQLVIYKCKVSNLAISQPLLQGDAGPVAQDPLCPLDGGQGVRDVPRAGRLAAHGDVDSLREDRLDFLEELAKRRPFPAGDASFLSEVCFIYLSYNPLFVRKSRSPLYGSSDIAFDMRTTADLVFAAF